jgi:uncharacterized protein
MAYALVTGASKGIGKAIATELAKKGFNLLLVARNTQMLRETADEIKLRFKVDVHFLAVDLSGKDAAAFVHDWCVENDYEISALVNNAGYGLSGKFETYPLQEHLNMMQLNMETVVKLCYLFIPHLKEQPKAYILNVASNAAYQAVPYLGLYAATKAFVLQFSRALHYELSKTSVKVTCVSPGPTDTDFAVRADVGPKAMKAAEKFNMSSEAVAKVAVNSMLKGRTEVVVGMVNKLGAFFVWLLPKKLVEKTAASIYE